MTPLEFQNAIIPKVTTYAGFPIIEAEQSIGDIPDGSHVIFNFITAQGKDTGGPNVSYMATADGLDERMAESVRMVISITAISDDNHAAITTAAVVRDWFTFYGADDLDAAGVVIVSATDIGNRDSINEDERRQGFDVTLRVAREVARPVGYFNSVTMPQGAFD